MKTLVLALAFAALVGGIGTAIWKSAATPATIHTVPNTVTAPSGLGQTGPTCAGEKPFRARTFGGGGAAQWNTVDPANPSIPPQP